MNEKPNELSEYCFIPAGMVWAGAVVTGGAVSVSAGVPVPWSEGMVLLEPSVATGAAVPWREKNTQAMAISTMTMMPKSTLVVLLVCICV